MDKFEVGKVYNWFERGFDPFTVLARTGKSITVCNGTNTWRMILRHDSQGEWVRDSSQPRYAQDMFVSRPDCIVKEQGEYGYLISYKNSKGKVIISSENGYETIELAEHFMHTIARYLTDFGFSVLSKSLLKDSIVCKTF